MCPKKRVSKTEYLKPYSGFTRWYVLERYGFMVKVTTHVCAVGEHTAKKGLAL